MKNLKTNIYFKVTTIVIITLLLLIPTFMIRTLITEREWTQNDAIREVSAKWGEEQTISGPFISIPYHRYVKQFSQKDSIEKIVQLKEYLHVLPTQLTISGQINPEKRHRGIYEIVVYNSKLDISGTFNQFDLKALDIQPENILFDKVEFVVGINDLRGIEKQVNLNWDEEKVSFNPGVPSNDITGSGINASLAIDPNADKIYNFDFSLDLKGSQKLYFTPVGKVTDIDLSSEWPNPSFNGAFLPDNREVSEEGFNANWNVLHLNRNYPQIWASSRHSIDNSAFGIDLLLPVDNYQKSYRSIRYAILFIGFTFLVFFFIEVLNKIFIHPIQYILVGVSLIVFYTLLLAISEHLKFNIAFIISAVATLSLIAGYVKAILKSTKLTMLITGVLTVLYSFIFVIIQLQDYALLIGSIGVFIILGIVMYFSRKIDWYNLNLEAEE
ncbi:cell envelope integrity protein CreD [Cyclobacterium qasimii]|uniref:Inner membrane protein CreD-like protein n=2 Tax=Cyclobacterium qasimii TaxID=1350429 RepID=S7WGC4_9BACT|nr:cell envelope integrity protein CreD [Cyclobacterium qasimii]EPR65809.1 Inner membrane protein CreD-like protein [Cyclobacterium qasimii M12-11B]GEO23248.1 cell envelope integrity protein CreD [Cyclobacterium qasimii]